MKDYSSYVAFIVATETEEKAIKNMYDWKPVTFSDDTQTYYSASIEKNGISHKIVYARQSEMGMTVAVTLTMKLIEHFRPQFMIMVGIAAGIARSNMAEQIYGDVVVADMIWNYTSGKRRRNNNAVELLFKHIYICFRVSKNQIDCYIFFSAALNQPPYRGSCHAVKVSVIADIKVYVRVFQNKFIQHPV